MTIIYTIIILLALITTLPSIINMLEGKKQFCLETVLLFIITLLLVFFLNMIEDKKKENYNMGYEEGYNAAIEDAILISVNEEGYILSFDNNGREAHFYWKR